MNRGMPADNQQHQLLVNATQNNERQQYQEQYQAHRRTELVGIPQLYRSDGSKLY